MDAYEMCLFQIEIEYKFFSSFIVIITSRGLMIKNI